MSIGLALERISYFSSVYDTATQSVQAIQNEIMTIAAGAVQNAATAAAGADARGRLAKANAVQGFAKEFLDYWKDVAKQFMSMVKSIQELSQGAR